MAGTEPRSNDSPRPAWAKAIRDLRLRLKLSPCDLGSRIGFSAMTISRWERGEQEPPSHGYISLGNLSRNATCWFFLGTRWPTKRRRASGLAHFQASYSHVCPTQY